jgi:hypothetical protein
VQSLAILVDLLAGDRRQRLAHGLLVAPDLARTTIYFSHYLFEAYRMVGAIERLLDRMALWFDLRARGFVTTLESPEPTRSDCHAWGAHPIYHYFCTLLGARPAEPGFRSVRIEPQLGPLSWLRGAFPHPGGETIRFDLRAEGDALRGEIVLPTRIHGALILARQTVPLGCGTTRV